MFESIFFKFTAVVSQGVTSQFFLSAHALLPKQIRSLLKEGTSMLSLPAQLRCAPAHSEWHLLTC